MATVIEFNEIEKVDTTTEEENSDSRRSKEKNHKKKKEQMKRKTKDINEERRKIPKRKVGLPFIRSSTVCVLACVCVRKYVCVGAPVPAVCSLI